jgi:UPF0716 protein FxsA
MRLFGLYVVVELIALLAVVWWLGLGWTLLLLLAGAFVGMWLVRREGARAALALAEAVRGGRAAHAELTDGALVGIAGLLILLPGVVSDALGLLLVLPPTRALARRWMVREAERRAPLLRSARIRGGATVIDGEVVNGPGAAQPRRSPDHRPLVIDGRIVESRVVEGRVVDK